MGFRDAIALDYFDALTRTERRKIAGCGIHLRIGDRLGQRDHQGRWRSPRNRRTTRPTLVIRHLLDDVTLRQASEIGIFRPSRSVSAMTIAACEHVWLAAVGDDVGQRRVVVRMPNRRDESIPKLAPSITGRAIGHSHRLTVVDRRLISWIVLWISPSRRPVRRCRHDNR